jgi:hypothetical protein
MFDIKEIKQETIMGEQHTMEDKAFEAMLVFMWLFYFMLMIPTIVSVILNEKTSKERSMILEARVSVLERELYEIIKDE